MKIIYDPETDSLYIKLTSKGSYRESEEIDEGIIVDYSDEGKVIGIEILNARKKLEEVKNLQKILSL